MLSWNTQLHYVVHRSLQELHRFVPTYCISSILLFCIFGIVGKYLHSKFYQQKKTSESVPLLPWITYLRVIISGRKHADVWFPQLIFGGCSLFWKEGLYGIALGPVKYVFLYSLEGIEFLLKSRTTLHKGLEYDFFRSVFGNGLFMTNASKWYVRRKQVTSTMHFSILDDYFHVFNKQANILVERIQERMKNETNIELHNMVGVCVFDSVLETILGISVNEVESQRMEFFNAIRSVDMILSKRVSLPWLWSDFIFSRTKDAKMLESYKDTFKKFVIEIIEKRKSDIIQRRHVSKGDEINQSSYDTNEEIQKRLPTLDLLMEYHLKDNSVTYEELIHEVLNYVAAGHDTTNLAVSWTLYLLGLDQDIQRKVHQELDDVLGDDINRIITAEEVRSLNYLHCALKESMRLYPPAGMLSRILPEDAIINGCQIEKGTTLVIPVYAVHRNPEVFPNPEKFIPERFSKENCKNIPPFAYIPFSAGPRNCLGQRFAVYNAMTVLSTVLRHFSIEATEHRDKTGVAFRLLMAPENEIRLKFTRRQLLKDYSR